MRYLCSLPLLAFTVLSIVLPNVASAQSEPDDLREFQHRAAKLDESNWIQWGDKPGKFSSHTSHSNRLIPVYTWGLSLDSVQEENSVYREMAKLKEIFGFEPTETVNPNAEYFDQTQLYDLQKKALKSGKKNIILMVFDGMDWQTTQAASIYKNKSVLYTEGRGTGLGFLDYVPLNAECDYGFCVTTPRDNTSTTDVDAQVLTKVEDQKFGGYSAAFGGATPWSKASNATYLTNKRKDIPHPYTDSASSATSINSGWKTYNGAINVDAEGRQLTTLAHEMQKDGFSIGVVTSVPISHATPACVYAHNVHRGDYQDISRDLLGLASVSHKGDALPGVDVLLGAGWGQSNQDDREGQGANYVPGNKYLAANDMKRINVLNGGKYVVAERTAGRIGSEVLAEATEKAISSKKRLFGFFGANKGHLPFQTADGKFDPTDGQSKTSNYKPEEIAENPTLTDLTKAAFNVLEKNEKGFFLMVEAGDVDWGMHNNNIDDTIGAVLSGEDAFEAIVEWVEANSNWEETCLILTSDHGHMMQLQDPNVLTGERKLGDEAVFKKRLAQKKEKDAKEKAKKAATALAKANQEAIDAGGIIDSFETKKHDTRQALRGDWKYVNNIASCVSDPELYKKYKNHGPILRWPLEFKDGTVEMEVKTKDVERLVFSLNEKGHVFRTVIGDSKKTKVFGWIGQSSKENKPKTISAGFVPQIKSLNNKWTKFKLVTRGEQATLTIGTYSKKFKHPSVGRKKSEVTLSFASGKCSVKNFRVKPSGMKTAKAQEPEVELKPIFDGKTLNGWHNPYDWGDSKVVGDEIHLLASKKFFLMSNLQYNDYVFEGDIRLPEGKSNSGFMLRGQEVRNKVFGYQAEADPTDRKWSGGLYDEGRRQWINPLKDQPKAQEAFKKTDWNKYRISCEGDHLQVWINGVQTTDYYDPVDLMGGIGLQHHGEDGQVYRFRNLKAASTGRHVWKPIFDGKSMDGWKTSGGGKWEIKDGVLVGTSKKSETDHGLFYSEDTFGDFTAKLTFRLSKGNSGFFYRSKKDDSNFGITGVQAELENSELIGGLFEIGGRKWIAQPLHYYPTFSEDRQKGRTKQWKSAHKAGEWSTLVVSAHGNRVVTHVGDILACDVVDKEGSQDGQFAVQLHAKQDMKIEVKSIELLVKEDK